MTQHRYAMTKVIGKYLVMINTGGGGGRIIFKAWNCHLFKGWPVVLYTRQRGKMTDNQYGVLTNFRPTLSDTDTLDAAFQTTGLLLFRATDAI
jgi:hypothetical protein